MKFNRRMFFRFLPLLVIMIGAAFTRGLHWLKNQLTDYPAPTSAEAISITTNNYSKELLKKESSVVIQVKGKGVTYWDGKSYPYVNYINQDKVTQILQRGLLALTGEQDLYASWDKLIPYMKGEMVAIKPNFNDLYDEFRGYVVAPQIINAILEGLINILGIPPENIIIYDVSRIIPDSYRSRIHFKVIYVEPYGSSIFRKVKYHIFGNPLALPDFKNPIAMRKKIKNRRGQNITCYLPKCMTRCEHLINIPIFKSHQFVLASGALKNHYGTVRFSDGKLAPEYLHPPMMHECIADLNAHPLIQRKTRLIVMDALFGRVCKKGGNPNLYMESLFLSCDPVAIDTITSAMILREIKKREGKILSDHYLELSNNLGLGVYEKIDDKQNSEAINFRLINL